MIAFLNMMLEAIWEFLELPRNLILVQYGVAGRKDVDNAFPNDSSYCSKALVNNPRESGFLHGDAGNA